MPLKQYRPGGYQNSYEQQNDTVTFSENSSPHTLIKLFDEEETMPEDEVREYVRSNNPKLFQKLRGLPLASSDIPMSFHGQRVLHCLGQNEVQSRSHGGHYASSKLPVQHAFKQVQSSTAARQPGRPYAETLTIKAKERILHKLATGYALYQRQLSPVDAPLPCDFKGCPRKLLNSSRLQYYAVEYDHANNASSTGVLPEPTEYYCNACYDTIFAFNEQENIPPPTTKAPGQMLLDGVHHDIVIDAASRLYPDIEPKAGSPGRLVDKHGCPSQAFNWPSNSPQNHMRRAHKLREIDLSLAEASKIEKSTKDTTPQKQLYDQRASSPEASVLITRPAYMEPEKERYKKQGLTKYDYAKYLKEKKQDDHVREQELDRSSASPVRAPQDLQERHCYCREVDDGTEMLRCSSELCPIGWFHFKCTGLDQLPTITQKFLCCYCSDGIDAFVTQDMLDEETDLFTEPNTPLTAGFAPAYGAKQDHAHLDQINETNSDTSYELLHEREQNGHKITKWSAVNNPESDPSVFTIDDQSANTFAVQADSDRSWEAISEDMHKLDSRSISNVTNHSPPRTSTSSPPAPSISDLTADNDTTTRETSEAPVTPPLQSVRPASKPWGTPINLDKLSVLDPNSPSTTCKRKRDTIDEDVEHGIRVDSEIPDSDEEGEEVPLMIDLRTLRECNR
ncbi:hypothetical protein PMZ80_002497 [Knufia obscura]|uniref:Zinc finger PHD-type domain-containing protein n=1 Tax=Knufia obscura TaxID=1635080 RepID=A0ABR0RYB2_9EURO|nr:hypothetical protein PMZ80_002497 [Knufia obscura]